MKKIAILTMLFVAIFVHFSVVIAEEEKKVPENVQEKIEARSPLGQMIEINYNLREPVKELKAEEKRLKGEIKIVQKMYDNKKFQWDSRVSQIEKALIFFENNSAEINEAGKEAIKKVAELTNGLISLSTLPESIVIAIEGKTDGVGNEDSNIVLGFERAKAVKIELAKNGIPETIFHTVPYGKYRFKRVLTSSADDKERVVSFLFLNPTSPPMGLDFEILTTRLKIVHNAIRDLERVADLNDHEIMWPYYGHANPTHGEKK